MDDEPAYECDIDHFSDLDNAPYVAHLTRALRVVMLTRCAAS
jgi:hypothetical protein